MDVVGDVPNNTHWLQQRIAHPSIGLRKALSLFFDDPRKVEN